MEQRRALDAYAVRAKDDEYELTRLVQAHNSFILRCASRTCKRFITESDDEYEIALVAFCEAVRRFDVDALEAEGVRFADLADTLDRTLFLLEGEGYLDAEVMDYVLVNVSADDEARQDQLVSQVEAAIAQTLARDPTMAYRIERSDRETASEAAEYGMSPGRYAAWQQDGEGKDSEDYTTLPVREIIERAEEGRGEAVTGEAPQPLDEPQIEAPQQADEPKASEPQPEAPRQPDVPQTEAPRQSGEPQGSESQPEALQQADEPQMETPQQPDEPQVSKPQPDAQQPGEAGAGEKSDGHPIFPGEPSEYYGESINGKVVIP